MKTKYEISAGGIVFKKCKTENVKCKIKNKQKYDIPNTKYEIQWLICQHAFHKGWVFPKGLIADNNKNESIEEAALRETEEEGGVRAKIIKKLPGKYEYFYKHEGQLIKKTVYYYLMEYLSGDPANHDWEMADAKFVSEDEIKKMLSFPSEKKAFEDAQSLFRNLDKQ